MALPLDRDGSGAHARQDRQIHIAVDDEENAQPSDDVDGLEPCRTGRNSVIPMAAEPDESHDSRIVFLAAAGVTDIMNERPMIGPTVAGQVRCYPGKPP